MRKFFSQKSKHKAHQHQILSTTTSTLIESPSLVVSTLPFNKDDETQITSATTKKSKSQVTSSHSQTETNPTIINSTSSESISSEIINNNQLKQDENGEKSKKLFVVVSGKKFALKILNTNLKQLLLTLY